MEANKVNENTVERDGLEGRGDPPPRRDVNALVDACRIFRAIYRKARTHRASHERAMANAYDVARRYTGVDLEAEDAHVGGFMEDAPQPGAQDAVANLLGAFLREREEFHWTELESALKHGYDVERCPSPREVREWLELAGWSSSRVRGEDRKQVTVWKPRTRQ